MMKKVYLILLLLTIATAGCGQTNKSSWSFGPFYRPAEVNPIITPNATFTFDDPMSDKLVHWESMSTFNPAAVVRDGKIYVLYRAEDKQGAMKIGGHTSRIGMAISNDGLHFNRLPKPVLYPDEDNQKKYEWPGGCEDPRIVETEDGRYVMAYTQWNRKIPRLSIATSTNLHDWKKYGPAFAQSYDGKYLDIPSKSGAILTHREGNHLIATKVNGMYWMYWGVPKIRLATSDDLIHWTPVENSNGQLKTVLAPRPGHFDSWLVEAGPPAVLTDDGILVIYNGGDSAQNGDPAIPDSMYAGGQALFSPREPAKLMKRLDNPFIQPREPYEKSGQYKNGTTFLEGLVHFRKRWFIYYGTADSRVGVVSWHPSAVN